MKIALLVTNVEDKINEKIIERILEVTTDLAMEVKLISLYDMPHFTGIKLEQVEETVQAIAQYQGVIMLGATYIMGVESTIQNFMDHMSLYIGKMQDKPLLTIIKSKWMGEYEAVSMIQKGWRTIGGRDGGYICFNEKDGIDNFSSVVDRSVENLYRIIKQNIKLPTSWEYEYYLQNNLSNTIEITKSDAQIKQLLAETDTTSDGELESIHEEVQHNRFITDQKAFENNTDKVDARQSKEEILLDMLRNSMNKQAIEEPKQHQPFKEVLSEKDAYHKNEVLQMEDIGELKSILTMKEDEGREELFEEVYQSVYKKPMNSQVDKKSGKNLLKVIPHRFLKQYAKDIILDIKYTLDDTNEGGYIVIREDGCRYSEVQENEVDVHLKINTTDLEQILKGDLTYQKAFMIGKLKIRGEFRALALLDQMFRTMSS